MKINLLALAIALNTATLLAQSTTITLTTNANFKDAVIETYAPNLNGGNNDVAFISAWTNSGSNNTKRYLLEFDFSSIPVGAVIDSAKLSLYKANTTLHSNIHQGSNSWSLRRITQAWSEQTVTWNNQPTSTQLNKTIVAQTTSGTQDFPNIDITDLVVDVLNGNNYGFIAQLENETPYKTVIIASSDYSVASKRPRLEITYHLPCATTALFSYQQTSGNTVNFTDSSTTVGIASYYWDFGDGTFSNQQNPVKTYNNAGSYTACLTLTDSCGVDTSCQTINLCLPQSASFYYSANSSATVQFQGLPNNGLSYWWNFGDGNFTTLQNPLYTYSSGGTYTVCFARTDSCGTDTMCQNVSISGFGVDELTAELLGVFPNPASDMIRIERISNDVEEMYMVDAMGRIVLRLDKHAKEVNIGHLRAGIYWLRIIDSKSSYGIKLIKQGS